MTKCPLFGKCGGCKFDFADTSYREKKLCTLPQLPITGDAVWTAPGLRRRADFCFSGSNFGFFESKTKNIVPISQCPNLTSALNNILPSLSKLPWAGSGSCLITECDNGIDIAITSPVPYVTPEFRTAAQHVPAIRITWNEKTIKQTATPTITFGNKTVPYTTGAFLQPTTASESVMRDLVQDATAQAKHIADLFCGLGNFTFATKADGFDIVGTGVKRDLFKKPLTVGMLNTYDCIIMDPPRAGAEAQCRELIKSNVQRIIYISCNPITFKRDMKILTSGGYKTTTLIPIDQFVGSDHWELFSIFEK